MRLLTPACPGQSPTSCHSFTWRGVPLAHESHEEVMHVTCRKGPPVTGLYALGALGKWLAETGREERLLTFLEEGPFLRICGNKNKCVGSWKVMMRCFRSQLSILHEAISSLPPPGGVSQADLIPEPCPPPHPCRPTSLSWAASYPCQPRSGF